MNIDLLHQQNHDIAELSKVLTVLIEDREVCDSQITCELFMRYSDKVKNHLEAENDLYSPMLSSSDKEAKCTAERFLEGSREISRVFGEYIRRWCTKSAAGLKIGNHDLFVKETKDMFRLISERVNSENEELYPAAMRVSGTRLKKTA